MAIINNSQVSISNLYVGAGTGTSNYIKCEVLDGQNLDSANALLLIAPVDWMSAGLVITKSSAFASGYTSTLSFNQYHASLHFCGDSLEIPSNPNSGMYTHGYGLTSQFYGNQYSVPFSYTEAAVTLPVLIPASITSYASHNIVVSPSALSASIKMLSITNFLDGGVKTKMSFTMNDPIVSHYAGDGFRTNPSGQSNPCLMKLLTSFTGSNCMLTVYGREVQNNYSYADHGAIMITRSAGTYYRTGIWYSRARVVKNYYYPSSASASYILARCEGCTGATASYSCGSQLLNATTFIGNSTSTIYIYTNNMAGVTVVRTPFSFSATL